MSEIAILGAGAWGTALSIVLGRTGNHRVRLWAHEKAVCETISHKRMNEHFLPGHLIPACVQACGDLAEAVHGIEILVIAVPSQHCRRVLQSLPPFTKPNLVISATKGLEESSLFRMTEVISQVLSGNAGGLRIGALSGPSFALDAARGDPTAVAIASTDFDLARTVQQQFSSPSFRVYTNDDPIGVELAGALKNTIAIAAGVSVGLGLGHNSIAALMTRGLAEMTRLVIACGGKAETMSGLAGLGDLVLTCTGGLSRNRSVGVELGKGRKLPEIIAGMHGMVAEGIFTTRAALGLAKARRVEMPIVEQMHAILYQHRSPSDAIQQLMSRGSKSESV